jgi:hypothetical protein
VKSRTRIKPVSDKRLAEREERDAVRETTLRRAGFRCQAAGAFGILCGGHLDVHELQGRGVRPGGHLDDTNTIALCRIHHSYVTDHPQDAHDAGLLRWSWE